MLKGAGSKIWKQADKPEKTWKETCALLFPFLPLTVLMFSLWNEAAMLDWMPTWTLKPLGDRSHSNIYMGSTVRCLGHYRLLCLAGCLFHFNLFFCWLYWEISRGRIANSSWVKQWLSAAALVGDLVCEQHYICGCIGKNPLHIINPANRKALFQYFPLQEPFVSFYITTLTPTLAIVVHSPVVVSSTAQEAYYNLLYN